MSVRGPRRRTREGLDVTKTAAQPRLLPLIAPARRLLGSGERLFVAQHRFTATNVTRVIALEGVLPPATLRAALAVLQERHPRMRARIIDEEPPYFLEEAAPALRLRLLARRDDQHWRAVLEELLNARLDHAAGRLFEAHYLYSDRARRSELILVGEHAACDGISMNSLSAELLELCAGAPRQAPRPALPVLDALLPRYSLARRLLSLGKVLPAFTRTAIERRLREAPVPALTSAYTFTVLSRERTAALVAKARLAGTTVTGALMAATLSAVRAVRPSAARITLSVPVNLRPWLAKRALTPADVGNYTSAALLEARSADQDMWPLARALKAELDIAAASHNLLPAVPLMYGAARLFVRSGRPPLAHAMISNSGMVSFRDDYGAFRPVGFFSATSAPLVSADFCFFCNTFASRLCINLVFAPELVSRAEADAVLGRTRELLVGEE